MEEVLGQLYARGGAWTVLGAGAASVLDVVRRLPKEWWAARRGRGDERSPASVSGGGERLMGILNELRVAGRALARRPSFTTAAVLTLALGIGANVAIFTVVNAVLLRPLAYPEADEIVSFTHRAPGLRLPELRNSQGMLQFYREEADFFASLAGYRSEQHNLIGGREPERVDVVTVQPALFDVLRVRPALGRPFSAADGEEGAPPVAILTHAAWRTRFGSDPRVVGSTIRLDDVATEVVGVMPEGFAFHEPRAVALLPLVVPENGSFGTFGIEGVARLASGVGIATAAARAADLQTRLPDHFPDVGQEFFERAEWSVEIERLQDRIVDEEVASALWIVLATVAFVLLIACANVANLFLVRAESRQKELAVRAAIGAGGGRIALGFLTESLLLGLAGGALGLLLAWGGVELLVARGPASIPRLHEVGIDAASLAFTAVVSVVAALALGALPLLRYSGAVLLRILRDGGRTSTEGRQRHRTRSVLVAGQLALALVLLVGSGLMLRSFERLRAIDPGFDPSDVLVVGLSLGSATPAREAADFYQRVAEEVRALPGVRSVGLTSNVPVGEGSANGSSFDILGREPEEGALPPTSMYKVVGADYAEALEIPLVEGRMLTRADWEGDAEVVLVNEAFARRYLDGRALDESIRLGGGDSTFLRVVGVLGSVHETGLREEPGAWAYLPMASTHRIMPMDRLYLLVRTEPGVGLPVRAVREVVARLGPDVPVTTAVPMREMMARDVAETSFTMTLLGIAAAMALFLGAVGLFGVVSYVVGQRTREIGVRVALGAAGSDIRRMVLRQGAGVVLAGVAIGLAGAAALSRLMSAILFEVSAMDPITFLVAPALLVAVAVLATWLPARRAARVDPVEALRAE